MVLPRVVGLRLWNSLLTGALLTAALASPAVAAEHGRVFYSAEERRALEARVAEMAQSSPTNDGTGQESVAQDAAVVHFNGVVRRSQGPDTAWIDGRLLGPDVVPANMRARLIGERLELTGPDSRRLLKPGERDTIVTAPNLDAANKSDTGKP